jgi:membrane associated rhomboid family serine protease
MSSRAFHGEPWRLAASALPHGGFIHLLFNVYWLWVLGTLLEEELGHFSTLLLTIVLAAGSAAAQFTFSTGGIGLSGVGYGIVGFLWMASRIHPRFRDAMDMRTLQLFLGWGLLCIVLTLTGAMAVANYAHAAGFILGIPLAYAFLGGSAPRNLAGAFVTLVLCAAFLLGSSLWRAQLNLSSRAGEDDREIATHLLEDKQYDKAIVHFERAIALSPKDDNAWYNYGVALQNGESHIGVTPIDAFRKALALAPKEEIYKNAVGKATWNEGLSLEEQGKHDEAQKLFDEARRLSPELAKKYPTTKPAESLDPPPPSPVAPVETTAGSGAVPTGSAGAAGSAQ